MPPKYTARTATELKNAVEDLRRQAASLNSRIEDIDEQVKKNSVRSNICRANECNFGDIFSRIDSQLYQRVRPASFLLNSALVQESLANGKILVMHIKAHTIFFIRGDEVVSRRPSEV